MSTFHSWTPTLLYLLSTATLGPLLFGYHLAELNEPQAVITCQTSHNPTTTTTSLPTLPQCLPMTPLEFGLVSSFFTLGGLVGALCGGPVTSNYGRLRAMLIASVFAAIGPVFEALATNIAVFVVGRTIAGLGAGAATVIVPIYISEISPPGQKGFFGSFTQVSINFGILITQVLGLFLSRGQLWRIILGVGGGIAGLQFAGLLLGGAESPKWLAEHGRAGQAKRVLRRMRGHEADIDEEVEGWGLDTEGDVEDEEESLLEGHDEAPSSSSRQANGSSATKDTAHELKNLGKSLGFLHVLQDPHTRPAVLAVAMIMVAQQLCGINSIVMYGVSLLSDLLEANAALLNVAVGVLNVVVTISAAPLVDKLGRKPCLLISITGMGINSILLAIGIMKAITVLSCVAVLLFVASFGLGLGPVPFLLSSELVAAEAVGATQSWALASNWIATFVVAQFFPLVNEKLGKGQVYFVFAGFAVLAGTLTWFFVPETAGKRDADEVWGRTKDGGRRED
ncbi:Bifunctional purine biosynthesis protein PurH [Elasticomyces elasticus]|nr:Bifunctional purine biosynthesis protein PurH [Elasticomyces elasticus]KAK3633188.1 Bifunctional purine biosynthesis protein PurH [Elasticomyces elasticus]KAK4922375.1 Bifunctional purine biosynthesis protein PurH [Elasticomyces elasticus]KAK5765256.1 Bifunctional purine biosynthesis protein PurH [Elasticomyces elasticus]